MVDAGIFPPGERAELIDGEMVALTPQGSERATAVRLVEGSLYARAGVAEYWLVNLRDRRLEVHREPARQPEAPYG